jgi:hypothetical protein
MGVFSSDNDKVQARQLIARLGEAVTFSGASVDVSTYGYIERADDLFGEEAAVSDARYVASLLVEDVGIPHRGDLVTDDDGQTWELVAVHPSIDPWIIDLTVQAK